MPADPGRRLDALTGLRAVAAFGVVATHVGFQTGRAIDAGSPFAPLLARLDFGVTLFFLLSGFLLFRPFVQAARRGGPQPALRPYLARRLVRVLPAYLLAVGATFLLLSRDATRAQVVAYLTMTQPFTAVPADRALTQMWTLPTEVSFYLALPLLAALTLLPGRGTRGLGAAVALRRVTVLAGVLLVATWLWAGWCLAGGGPGRAGLLWLPAHLDWFAAGMVLAALHVTLPDLPASHRVAHDLRLLARSSVVCWVVAAAVFVLATRTVAGPLDLTASTTSQWFVKHALYLVTATLLLLPPTVGGGPGADRRVQRVLAARPVVWLGEVSYGVYLWHLLVMFWLVDVLGLQLFQGGFWLLLGTTAAGATAVAAASYYLVERPAVAWVHRRTAAPSPGGQHATATATATST